MSPESKNQPPSPVNTEIPVLLQLVQNATDPWFLFMCVNYASSTRIIGSLTSYSKALFLQRLSRRDEAVENIILSIAVYPWNWSAWMLLAECLGDGEEVSQIPVLG